MRAVGLNMGPRPIGPEIERRPKNSYSRSPEQLSAHAGVILLDEPTSSLSAHEADNSFPALGRAQEATGPLIYVSHKLDEVYKISDRVSVMRDGKLIGSRMTGELPRHELIRMMIGREAREQRIGDTRTNRDNIILQVDNLAKAGKCKNASFELREGEILGFYGLVGAGRTELARVLIGEERAESARSRSTGK